MKDSVKIEAVNSFLQGTGAGPEEILAAEKVTTEFLNFCAVNGVDKGEGLAFAFLAMIYVMEMRSDPFIGVNWVCRFANMISDTSEEQ